MERLSWLALQVRQASMLRVFQLALLSFSCASSKKNCMPSSQVCLCDSGLPAE